MYFIPCAILACIFYNNKRSELLIEKFDARDEYVQQRDTNRVILYFLIPFLITIILMFLKQKGIF